MWPSAGAGAGTGQGGRRPQDTIQVPRLEPKDLYERRIRRDHARLRAYNTLLEQIYHRIYATSQLGGNTSSVLYTVPPFLLGLPKLDMEDCIVYLVWQLREAKFVVRFTWPNLLYVSWHHHEGEYLSRKNPIVQAMIPEAAPAATAAPTKPRPKVQSKASPPLSVSYADEIALIAGPGPGPGLHRRAAEYQPPSSFIQTLDAPMPRASSQPQGGVLSDLWSVR